jgi:hypothetical protein
VHVIVKEVNLFAHSVGQFVVKGNILSARHQDKELVGVIFGTVAGEIPKSALNLVGIPVTLTW